MRYTLKMHPNANDTRSPVTAGPVQGAIERKLVTAFSPVHLEIINESGMHSVPPGSESHFKVTVVCEQFNNQSQVQRHRAVNTVLADELNGPIHALSLNTMTPDEWFEKGGIVEPSPPCLGGSKLDAEK
jgi:BolA protein